MDKENVNFAKVVSDLHIKFGKKVIPFTLALGEGENFKGIIDVLNKKAYEYKGFERVEVPIPEIRIEEVNHVYDTIVEVVAETDDELMEKFFNEEEFSHEEFLKGVTSALLNGSAVPLICGSATTGAGIDMLLDVITDYMPAPDDKRAKRGFRNEDENVRKISKDEPFSAVVFKTIVDPFIGRISIFKVISGKIDKDTVVYNSTKGQEEKVGSLFYLNGKTQIETKEIIAGDIGAISKLTITQTGDTLCDKNNKTLYKKIKYPKANLYFAIEPKSKNDEDKISIALHKLQEEDPSFVSVRNKETKQLLIGGQGNVPVSYTHLTLPTTERV